MSENSKTNVVILGGGFAGIYAAICLEKTLAREQDVDVTLVNRDNFFLFTPMLHEVAGSDLDITHIVAPIRKLLRHVRFFDGLVESIDLEAKRVTVSHGIHTTHAHALEYDHLILALGSVTNFYNLRGLKDRALTMRTLGDAIHLRNQMLAHLEEADFECCDELREPLLTFVVAGGGFAGVETIAVVNDFVREVIGFYPHLKESMLRVVLVHSGPVVLPELSVKLGQYVQKKLTERKVEIRLNTRVKEVSDDGVVLSDNTFISTHMLVWTAGTSANPLLDSLPCVKEWDRVMVNDYLEVPDWPGVWALGDCASVPDRKRGGHYPPTAQHACRAAKVVADNITAVVKGGRKRQFSYTSMGQLVAIGRRTGVANIMGRNFSGFFAWWLWRTIYLSKLPGFEKKLRVALDWTLDLLFSKDLVKFVTLRAPTISQEETPAEPVDHASAHGVET